MVTDPLIEREPEMFLVKVPGFDVHVVHFCNNMEPCESFNSKYGENPWEYACRWLAEMRKRGYVYVGYATFYGDPAEEFYAAKKLDQIKHALDNEENYKHTKELNCMWLEVLESNSPIEQQRWIRNKLYPLDEKME